MAIGRRVRRWVVLASLVLLVCVSGSAGAQAPAAPGTVWVIPVEGTIELGLADFIKRVVSEAEAREVALLLFEINTFGGRVDAATEIRDAIIRTHVPTAAFITERAISAGALVALAADTIVMAPGATFGAAQPEPLDAKTLSYVRAEFEATAERQGRDPRVAAAMVDADVAIEGLVEAGQILTLTTARAVEHGFADHVAATRREALAALGLAGATVVVRQPGLAERVVRFFTHPVVAQILLVIGFIGLLAELASPGWGLPGSVGLACLALFFGSRLLTGLVGVEAVLLFVLGIVLVLLELFVVPGFGVLGIGGLVAMGAGLFMAFPDARTAVQALAIVAVALVALILLFLKRFQRSALWGRLVLKHEQKDEEYRAAADYSTLLGREGTAETTMRPAGRIKIGGEYYDAVSEGEFIPQGQAVRVVKVEGSRIVVRSVSPHEK